MDNRSKTGNTIIIEKCISIEEYVNELSTLLIQVVEDGASIGFLSPLNRSEANQYWGNVLNPGVILFLAKMNNVLVGTVQLHLCQKQNGGHRAEIAKLMTHPNYRRNGIGRLLMEKAQETALQMGRTLLILDTREGDPSNLLYSSLGYIQGGRIPSYARNENGLLDPTIIYYKDIM
ncbi:GNAT family N-acetyltransferase [Neobacillus cucumis]|uniref:GNAT family N-acetyltransferase n=1 Tax=Neobacillus cucumis TaxID=1740721 RepID=UPI0018DF4788|nr:GNAT family N-acetyltransferase [Neobacillus cucumis]MBI0579977.1 GNAT family N-acetyltransferase [Neobacillus cucumis]